MNTFYAKDGLFWLNDQPQLIQAGEFHYFRTPVDQWRHRLGLLKTAGFNAVAAYIPWLWHQLEEDSSDLDGHSHPMRDLAGFLDLATDMDLLIIARPGPYIMAETINEGIPPWVFNNYPQISFTTQTGEVLHLASYLHPDFLACVRKWYKSVFEVLTPRQITNGGNIIMIQLDNEMGMPQWVRNIFDTNPDTLTWFAAWLRKTYRDHLSARYPINQLVEFLRQNITTPSKPHGTNIIEDYRHFYRDYLRDYTSFLWAEAKSNGMDVPPIVNVHGFMNGGKTFPIGLSQLIKVMEMDGMISATDVYPITIGEGNFAQLLMVNEITKALHNPQQALFSIEFEAGGNSDFGTGQTSFFDLHTRLCISTGMRAINHYLFFDGENDPVLSPVKRHAWGHPVRKDGTLRHHYHRYPKLSSTLAAYGTDLIRAQPETVATVGFMLDYFMTEVNSPLTQTLTNTMTYQREVILNDFIGRGLALTHRPFNALDLDRSPLNVAQTPILFTMMDKQCNAQTQLKLTEYVRQGGKLILIGRMCEEEFNHNPCTLLQDAIGIQEIHPIKSDLSFTYNLIQAFEQVDIPVSYLETYTGDFYEVFATHNGNPVGFIKTIGKGKVLILGASFTANTLEDLDVLDRIARIMGCPPAFQLSTWVDVRLSKGEKGSFLFINNYQDDPIETTIEYQGKMLFGGNPTMLPARRGVILPLEWQIKDRVKIHYLTSEIVEITEGGSIITIKTDQKEFTAELSLSDYFCDQPNIEIRNTPRIRIDGKEGYIVLKKTGS